MRRMPRRAANGWLNRLTGDPPTPAEPTLARQAAAILDNTPNLCGDKLLGLPQFQHIEGEACRLRQLMQGIPKTRRKRRWQAIIEERRTPNERGREASRIAGGNSGDRKSHLETDACCRQGSPAAAHARPFARPGQHHTSGRFARCECNAPEKSWMRRRLRNAGLRKAISPSYWQRRETCRKRRSQKP